MFLITLKETEFRHNTKIKGQDLYKILLKMIKHNPLKLSLVNTFYNSTQKSPFRITQLNFKDFAFKCYLS